jgi:PAS domain S-box-containing protein
MSMSMSQKTSALPALGTLTAWAGALGILVGTLGILLAGNPSWIRFFDNLHWTCATTAAAILAGCGAQTTALEVRTGMRSLALGLGAYAVGQVCWDLQAAIGYSHFPSPSDFFYLWLGPCIVFGLMQQIHVRSSPGQRKLVWLDTLTLTVAMLTLTLVLYLPKRGDTALLALAILIAYPATLFAAVGVTLSMILALRLKLQLHLMLFLAGLLITALSWMHWNFLALDGTTTDGAWFNVLFSIGIFLMGWSVSRWQLERNTNAQWDRWCEGLLRMLPMVTVVMASGAVVLSHGLTDVPAIVRTTSDVGSVMVILLAMLRQASLLKERDQLLNTQQALLDNQKELTLERGLRESLVSNLPDLVWLKDPDGVYLSCNARFEAFFGARESDIVGKTDYDFVDTALADFFRKNDQLAIQSNGPRFNEEALTFALGGYCGIFETIKAPMRDRDGRLVGVLGIARDISERKQADQALQASLKEQVALLNEVHHRVNNNLQVIVSLLRLEAARSAHPDTKVVLKEMLGRIRSMALLHELLYRSNTFASVDLAVYLKQLATQAFRAQNDPTEAIRLQLNLASVQASMDQATPCGLLVNELISNCLKHAFPQGRGGEVRVDLQALPFEKDEAVPVRLCVSDTGIGLGSDFETKRSNSLGLQLAADLSRQLGGALEIGPGPMFAIAFKIQPMRGNRP